MNARNRNLVAFAVINVAILVGGWFMLVSPQRNDAATTAAQEQVVMSQLAALTGKPQHPAPAPAIHTSDLYALGTALPSQVDQPDLLFELDRLAQTNDVKILNLTPQTPTMASSSLSVQPINLSLAGSYFHVTGFLRSLRVLVSDRGGRLVANGPLFAVTSVSLAPGTSDDGTAKAEVATVGMAAYYYGAIAGATPPPSTDTTTTSTTGS